MLITPLQVSAELKILRSLNTRMKLSSSEKQYYTNLEKGYDGEKSLKRYYWKASLTISLYLTYC